MVAVDFGTTKPYFINNSRRSTDLQNIRNGKESTDANLDILASTELSTTGEKK